MSRTKNVYVAGATGAVGFKLCEVLAVTDQVSVVYSETRVKGNVIVPMQDMMKHAIQEVSPGSPFPANVSAVFCCLGTTIKKAGSDERFRAIDFDMVMNLARTARANGVSYFAVVSSVGADASSSNLYIRTKGEVEAALRAIGFPQLLIVRPGVLNALRRESRCGEECAVCCLNSLCCCCTCGVMGRVRPIPTLVVAHYMARDWAAHLNDAPPSGQRNAPGAPAASYGSSDEDESVAPVAAASADTGDVRVADGSQVMLDAVPEELHTNVYVYHPPN